MNAEPYAALQAALGCAFRDPGTLREALTHSSTGAAANYERLEFLGDRVIGLVMAEILYSAFPQDSEGDLAKRHAALVQGETLAAIARAVDVGSNLVLSAAERASGGDRNDNILADGLEAVIGALFLDSGMEACRVTIRKIWDDRVLLMRQPPQDAKTALQEWAQGRALPLPTYTLATRSGPDHAPSFEIAVAVEGHPPAVGKGSSRRTAEKEAARLLLEQLTAGKT